MTRSSVRFWLPAPKNPESSAFRIFFIQAAGLAYHRRAKRGAYHQPRWGCISSRASVHLACGLMIYNAPHWWYAATSCGWYTRLTPWFVYKCVLFFGGERGIRTLGTVLAFTRFPVVRLRPAQPSLRTAQHNYHITNRSLCQYVFWKKSEFFLKKRPARESRSF